MRLPLLLIFLCFFSGCIPKPPPDDDPFEFPEEVLDLKVQELQAQAPFKPGDWPQLGWWKEFKDPQLTACIEQALGKHPSIWAVEERYAIALAQARETQAILFPWLSVETDIMRFRQSQTGLFNVVPGVFPLSYTQPELLFNLQAEIDWWGKNLATFKSALGEANAASLEVDASVLMVSTAVASSYYNLQISYARQENAQRQAQNREQYYKLLDQLQNNGVSSDISVQIAIAKWHSSEENYQNMAQLAALEKNNLHAWMAGDFLEPITPKQVQVPETISIPKNISLDLLSRRPDVLAQLQIVESGSQGIHAARAAFYPNINLSAIGGWQTIHPGKLFERQSIYGTAGPTINLPIFQGGLLAAQYDESLHTYNEAVYRYEDQVLQAVKETLDAIENAKAFYLRTEASKKAAEARQTIYAKYQDRLKKGIASQLELLAAEYDWLEQQDDLLKNQGNALLAYIQLIKALGGGFRD